MTAEVDFPRGGGVDISSLKRSRSTLFGDKKSAKPKDTQKNAKWKDDRESEEKNDVFHRRLTFELLTSGVKGLGIVKKINDLNVILECAGGVCVSLHGSCVSRIFTESLKTSDKTLEDIFTLGQAVAFKVLKQHKLPSGKKRIDVTTCPYVVNSHLVLVKLVERLVINAIVISVEEKGIVMDLGLSRQVTGFIPIDELPPYIDPSRICIGQVLMVRVKASANATTRVVQLSGIPEIVPFRDENLELNQLMPGMILKGEAEKVTPSGVYVVFQNDVKGFVHKMHMPSHYRTNNETAVKTVRVCVLACQQNLPLLVLTANNDIVSLTKPQNRLLPEKFKVGLKINCKVQHVEEKGCVYFTLDDNDNGNLSPIMARASRKEIDNPEKTLNKFKIGSVHRCRILGYRAVDRILIVSTRKEVLDKDVISADALIPGQVYMLTIADVKPAGIAANCCGIPCSIPAFHVKDRPVKKWERGYRIGQQIKCRFLYKHDHQKYAVFTAKPSMVESEDKIITQFDESLVGDVAMGNVIKQLDDGHLLVGFYNHVAGVLRSVHAKKLQGIYLGMPLKVRVVSVKKEERNMVLDLGEDFLNNVVTANVPENGKTNGTTDEKTEPKPKRVKKCFKAAKPFVVYTAKVIGGWPYGGTSPYTSAELLLNGGTVGRLHASELDLSGFTDGSKPMETFLARNKDRTVNVKVICVGQQKTISSTGKAKLMKDFGNERFVECTMDEKKVSETRHKLNLINFKNEFHYGDVVPIFYSKQPQGNRNGEINPLFKAIINENEYKDLENGTLIYAKVIGVNNTSRSKCVLIGKKETAMKDSITNLKRSRKESLKSEVTEDTSILRPIVTKMDTTKNGVRTTTMPTDPKSKRAKFIEIQDPGFDWSTSGFTVEDLTRVGENKVDTSEDVDEEIPKKKKKVHSSISLDDALESIDMDRSESLNYSKLIAGDPNNVEPWIRCVAHFITKEKYKEAKEVIEKALKVINFKDTEDLYKIWVVYLNLEMMFGTEESLKVVFEKACSAANSLRIHKHLANMYKKHSKIEEATDVYETMIKKFHFDDLEVWYLYGEHLLEIGESEKCRDLLQRALQSLEKKHHVMILCRFAQLEYRHGDVQRGRTMFEKIVHTYGKKLQVWNLFVDMVVKHEGIEEARKVFDRAISAVGSEKIKSLLKKWLVAEQKFGDLESQNLVRKRASKIVKSLQSEEV